QIVLNAIQETSTWKRLISKTETVDGVITTTTFSYDPQVAHTNIVSAETRDSEFNLIRTEIRYAHEMNNQILKDKNIIGVPLESEVKLINSKYPSGKVTSGSRLTFKSINNQYIPSLLEEHLT